MYRATEETATPQRPGARPIRDLGPGWLVALAAILLVATGLRVGYALNPADPQAPDSRGYARIAQSLYQDGRF